MAVLQAVVSYLLLSPVSVVVALVCAVVAYSLHKANQSRCPINPFAADSRRPPVLTHDKDSVIKQGEEAKEHPQGQALLTSGLQLYRP